MPVPPPVRASRRPLGQLLATAAASALMLLAPTEVRGQGFVPGELLILGRPQLPGCVGCRWLARADLVSGQVDGLVQLDQVSEIQGVAAFDPYRRRILLSARIDGVANDERTLLMIDSAGQALSVGLEDWAVDSLAPTGDGRVFMRRGNPSEIWWLDGANRLHQLLDASGAAAPILPWAGNNTLRGMVFDPSADSLLALVAGHIPSPCSPLGNQQIAVLRIPLTPDGTQVAGPIECVAYDIDPSGTYSEVATGLSWRPDGQLLVSASLGLWHESFDRLLELDPVTLTLAPFATPVGFPGANSLLGACWSATLDGALVLESHEDNLHLFGPGEVGAGTLVPTSVPLGSATSTGHSTLFEVPLGGCPGAHVPYGLGLAGTGGQVPALFGSGCPAPGDASALHLRDGRGAAPGLLFVGLDDASLPFKGGSLHLVPLWSFPLVLTGPAGLAGAGAADVPVIWPLDPALSGLSLVTQAGLADEEAPADVSLTQGLRIELG